MTKPKAAFVRINKDFLLVTSFIRGMIAITDPDQDFIFNEVDISDLDLGRLIKEKLYESKEISFEEFQAIFNSEKNERTTKKSRRRDEKTLWI